MTPLAANLTGRESQLRILLRRMCTSAWHLPLLRHLIIMPMLGSLARYVATITASGMAPSRSTPTAPMGLRIGLTSEWPRIIALAIRSRIEGLRISRILLRPDKLLMGEQKGMEVITGDGIRPSGESNDKRVVLGTKPGEDITDKVGVSHR